MVVRIEEEAVPIVDAIGHGILEVWVRVHADEVGGADDSVVGAVDPGSPGINVTDRLAAGRSASDGLSDLADVVSEVVWGSSDARLVDDARRRNAVQVLRAHGDTGDQVGEGGAELADGAGKGSQLIVDVGLASRCPETQEQGGLGVDGSLNRLRGGLGSAGLDQGEDARTGEAGSANEFLSRGEVILELSLGDRRVVGIGRAIVEALVGLG